MKEYGKYWLSEFGILYIIFFANELVQVISETSICKKIGKYRTKM